MQIGLKIYPEDLYLVDQDKDIVDFFEIFILPDMDVRQLEQYKGLIKVVHAAHQDFGVDIADPDKYEFNRQALLKARKAADILDAQFIIVHPGAKHNEKSKQAMFDFLEKNFDQRYIFENLITDYHEDGRDIRFLSATPDNMKELLDKFNSKMVLDFGHAICEANITNKDPDKLIDEFFALRPVYFHASGLDINSKVDSHGYLSGANNDYRFFKKIPHDAMVTFETGPHNRTADIKDIELFRGIVGGRDCV